MTAKMCNTINQNIEPFEVKLIDQYIKKFGTLLNNDNDDNSNATEGMDAERNNDEENLDNYLQPNAVWDRGKHQQQQEEEEAATANNDIENIRQLESSIETYLESHNMNQKKLSVNTPNTLNAYLLNFDDVLNDGDLESFVIDADSKSIKLRNTANEMELSNSANNYLIRDNVETTSLSNFHNVRDVLLNINHKLEGYLKTNNTSSSSPHSSSSTNLESKIEQLKQELVRYIDLINQSKEIELRKFSENMSNHSKIVCMRNAFTKRELNTTCSISNVCAYDTISGMKNDTISYYSNDSISNFNKLRSGAENSDEKNFMMKNCYDRCSYNSSCFDTNSVEYYSMLINEERCDNLLNDPPPFLPPRYQEREKKISLIYRSPDSVIKQWQKYQLNTITIKPKKNKLVKLNLAKEKKIQRSYDLYTFTLDYHKTKLLQIKLEKERKIRLICRTFFYLFGLISFILVVIVVQSLFNGIKK